jgi:hypothetical protein
MLDKAIAKLFIFATLIAPLTILIVVHAFFGTKNLYHLGPVLAVSPVITVINLHLNYRISDQNQFFKDFRPVLLASLPIQFLNFIITWTLVIRALMIETDTRACPLWESIHYPNMHFW